MPRRDPAVPRSGLDLSIGKVGAVFPVRLRRKFPVTYFLKLTSKIGLSMHLCSEEQFAPLKADRSTTKDLAVYKDQQFLKFRFHKLMEKLFFNSVLRHVLNGRRETRREEEEKEEEEEQEEKEQKM
ncbi:hypothetical protein JEQ12_008976 [Ovis aries]|uniref:Uncharacterized protein n=1 Tax=Ovis aries TaxID=9940 RepID=A0A836ACN3_SHEEP|nr:hypothetical protein JEQ12_008976 [Ovis aries]